MTATLKTTIIQEPSSATANMTLDTSGGVAFGQNLSVAGTTTLTGGIASAGLPLKGASSGTTTLAAQSVASGTVTIPAGTGTAAVQGVSTNIVSGTAVASTSGTSIDFIGIPSWVKRITVMYSGVSTSGTSLLQIQIGAGSVSNTGYLSNSYYPPGPTNSGSITSGFVQLATIVTAAATQQGFSTIVAFGSNIWVCNGLLLDDSGRTNYNAGTKTLSGTLDRVRITTINGTDTFDAGSINILYE